jgi:hypothetical protein
MAREPAQHRSGVAASPSGFAFASSVASADATSRVKRRAFPNRVCRHDHGELRSVLHGRRHGQRIDAHGLLPQSGIGRY